MSDDVVAAPVRRFELRAEDGVRLAVHRLGEPGALPAVLVPGTFSNHTLWFGTRGTGLGRVLAEHGFEAWALDPRGHGASERQPRGERWTLEDWARRDLPAVVRAAAAEGGPVVVLGHSAGGAVALMAVAAEPELQARVSAIVTVATPLPWLQGYGRAVAGAVGLASHLLGRFPARLLGFGPEDEPVGVTDQWAGWRTGRHWRGRDGTDYLERIAALDTPALFVAAAGDRVFAPPAACRALFELSGSRDKTFLLCGRGTGFGDDFDHAGILASRVAREEIWPKLAAWLVQTGRG